jgi:phosphomannomutase
MFCSETNSESDLRVVYTAMHGVGYPYIQETFAAFKLNNPIPVMEQVGHLSAYENVEMRLEC